MKKLYKLFTVFIIIVSLLGSSSCTKIIDFLSKPPMMDMTPPPGPVEYQAGYVDGCTTAITESFDNIAVRTKNFYIHPILNKDSNLYRRMWRISFIYCSLWLQYFKDRHNSDFFNPSEDFKIKAKGHPWSKVRNILFDAPPGPENFRIGWKQGCRTGKAATGSTSHRFENSFIKDARFIEGDGFNAEFNKGWNTAFWYCQRYYDIYVSPDRRGLM